MKNSDSYFNRERNDRPAYANDTFEEDRQLTSMLGQTPPKQKQKRPEPPKKSEPPK